jgi:hypothetical protein
MRNNKTRRQRVDAKSVNKMIDLYKNDVNEGLRRDRRFLECVDSLAYLAKPSCAVVPATK